MAVTLTPRSLPTLSRSFATWMQSSRVGTTTSAWTTPRPSSIRSSSGTPNARVLPVPVRAWPMRSAPVRAIGMVSAWIGNAVSMPRDVRAATVSGDAPSWSKVDVDRAEPFDGARPCRALTATRGEAPGRRATRRAAWRRATAPQPLVTGPTGRRFVLPQCTSRDEPSGGFAATAPSTAGSGDRLRGVLGAVAAHPSYGGQSQTPAMSPCGGKRTARCGQTIESTSRYASRGATAIARTHSA